METTTPKVNGKYIKPQAVSFTVTFQQIICAISNNKIIMIHETISFEFIIHDQGLQNNRLKKMFDLFLSQIFRRAVYYIPVINHSRQGCFFAPGQIFRKF